MSDGSSLHGGSVTVDKALACVTRIFTILILIIN